MPGVSTMTDIILREKSTGFRPPSCSCQCKFSVARPDGSDRAVEHILQAGLEMADEVGIEQDGLALLLENSQ